MEEKLSQTTLYLQQWHNGDRQGLDALLEQHLPWLEEQVRRRMSAQLKNKAETCDYIQDAVVQFMQYAPRFTVSDKAHFRALLLKVVESTLHNKYRWFMARRREMARERPLPADTVLYLDSGAARTPSKSAERHEREAWVRLGMELLDPEDKELLVLRNWNKESFSHIGERLGITENAARLRHNRAMDRLTDKVWVLRRGKLPEAL
jgi:RNA polymerase sigma-70 factor (ECF subfamily)